MNTHSVPASRRLLVPAGVLLALCAAAPGAQAGADDPVKVDAKHYTVEFENAQVRVLRVKYGPHEKSVMHWHPATLAVFLTDGDAQFTAPDGKVTPAPFKAGTTMWNAAGKHLPENLGDKPFEVIVVELKGGHAKAK